MGQALHPISTPPGRAPAGRDPRPSRNCLPPAAARMLALQRLAGNAAVSELVGGRRRPPPLVVSRCGPAHPGCGCAEEERTATGAEAPPGPAVQRAPDPLAGGFPPLPADNPFGAPVKDELTFTDRFFLDGSLPTVCPRCHRDRPTAPMPPRYVDQRATEERLVTWGQESRLMLQGAGSIRVLQLEPGDTDRLVDDYGTGLTRRITTSHEFVGSPSARAAGADAVRRRWPEIQPVVREDLRAWYQGELATAVGRTPRLASPVLNPQVLRQLQTSPPRGRAPLGRLDTYASPGETYGIFAIDAVDSYSVWFHLPDQPLWLYTISQSDFVKHDPFVAEVAGQVHKNTEWILHVMPLMLKAGAFALGFSGNIAFVILGIALDEFAQEMEADVEGRPARGLQEILLDAGTQLLVDRVFHHLLGGSKAGNAAAAAGKNAARIERVAEAAAPAIRRELAAAEKPLVASALEAGTARKVTDQALRKEGYLAEVAVESGGERHLFRLDGTGHWCRFSTPVCGLDLGADLVKAAREPKSFTAGALADARSAGASAAQELEVLTAAWQRSRKLGRVDLSVLSREERAIFDSVVDPEEAARLTLAELRALPTKHGLARDVARAADDEAKLVAKLYREGRPLYEIMRAASPSSAATSATRRQWGFLDFVTTRAPRTGSTHIEHVVPLNDVVQMPGFKPLRPERQLEIVNDVRILRPMDARANLSRGDRSWHSWENAAVHYDYPAIARMRDLEDELRDHVARQIALKRG